MLPTSRLPALNAALVDVEVSPDYDLGLCLADRSFRARSDSSGRLQIEELQSGSDPDARTCLRVDSQETLARLGNSSNSKATAMMLVGQGKLQVRGDMSQLHRLRTELAPHASRLQAALQTPRASDLAGGRFDWLPDDASPICMNLRCGASFNAVRRRHHCRGCGQLFCGRCAPQVSHNARGRQRFCAACALLPCPGHVISRRPSVGSSGRPSATSSVFPLQRERAGTETINEEDEEDVAPIPSMTLSSADVLFKWQVEKELRNLNFWSRCCLVVAILMIGVGFVWTWELWWLLLLGIPRPVQVLAGMVVCAALYIRRIIIRLARVAYVCGTLLVGLTRASMESRGLPQESSDAIWAVAHHVHARLLFDAATSLSGFYVKVAQTLSVQTAIAEPFHVQLSKLQDCVPAESLEEVYKTLEEELGKNWRSRVQLDDGPVLGSATIAQVHKARLFVRRDNGTEEWVDGVIKIQHRKMPGNLTADTYAAGLMAGVLGHVSPALFEDFGAVIREAAEMSKAELDFRWEAESQQLARQAALSGGIDVVIPEVFPSLVTKRLLAMEFIDGVRIRDFAAEASSADRAKAVRSLVDFFAFSFTQAGIYNCDPHPGNLLVTRDHKLVVLDWGQAKKLTKEDMNIYSKIFMAAALEDPYRQAEAMKALGCPSTSDMMRRGSPKPVANTGALRFILRDSQPIQMDKEDFANLDKVFARFNGELAYIKGDAKEILRGPLLPFCKTMDLLHNVSTRLSVHLPLLAIFAARGHQCLSGPSALRLREGPAGMLVIPAAPSQPSAPAQSSRLRDLLTQLQANGDLLGAQLVVLDATSGAALADVSVGHCSYEGQQPVTRHTLFNLAETSKLVWTLGVLRLVDKGILELSSKLEDMWLTRGELKDATIEQILAHTVGLPVMFIRGVPDMWKLADLSWMLDYIEAKELKPFTCPGAKQHYHHLLWGWLLAGAMRGVRQDAQAVWNEVTSAASSSLYTNRQGAAGAIPQGENIADLTRKMASVTMEDMVRLFTKLNRFIDYWELSKKAEASDEDRANAESLASFHESPHWGMPSASTQKPIAEGLIPGMSGFGNAKNMARLLFHAAQGKLVSGSLLANARQSRHVPGHNKVCLPDDFGAFEESEWGLGLQLVTLPGRESESEKAWGHTSSGGSFALAIPGQRPLVAVLLLNRTDGWVKGVPQKVLQEVTTLTATNEAT